MPIDSIYDRHNRPDPKADSSPFIGPVQETQKKKALGDRKGLYQYHLNIIDSTVKSWGKGVQQFSNTSVLMLRKSEGL